MPSQRDRIGAVLETRGWTTPVDWQPPDVIDGLKPILRVAARIQELRDEGHRITTHYEPNGVARYVLDSVAPSSVRSGAQAGPEPSDVEGQTSGPELSLFPDDRPRSPYIRDEAA